MTENNSSSSRWDRFLDFLDSFGVFMEFAAAIGAPIAAGIERRKIIDAQDKSWLMRQNYRRNYPRKKQSRRNGKKK